MSAALSIAVVTETYPPEVNGVALSIARAVRGLRNLGHAVNVVRPRQAHESRNAESDSSAATLVAGIPVPLYPGLRFGVPAKATLVRAWSRERPDLVHVVTEGPLGWSAVQAARALQLPVTSDFRTNFHSYSALYGFSWLRTPVMDYLRHFHNRTQTTLVPTHDQRRLLARAGFHRLEVVGRGVDTALFAPQRRREDVRRAWGAGPRDLVVIHVGRLAREKNLGLLFKAFAAIRQSRPDARLVVTGDGPARKALERSHPHAIFTGIQRGEDLAACYAAGDLFVFPSLTETFGNVTLEAMASGLPVIAYDYAAAGEHIVHGRNGFVAKRGDENDFCRLAGQVAGERTRLRFAGAAARATALRLDWKRIASDLEALFVAVCDKGSGSIESGYSSWGPLENRRFIGLHR